MGNLKKSVQALLAHVNADIGRLPAPVLRDLAPLLAQAQRETEHALREWLKNVPDGAERFTAQQYRRALVQLREATAAIRQTQPVLAKGLLAGGRRAGGMAVSHLQQEYAFYAARFGGSIAPIPIQVASVVAHGEKMLIPRFRSSAARYAGSIGQDIRTQLGVGVVRGESFHQLAMRLVRLGGPRGAIALRGVRGAPGAYVEHIGEGLFKRYRGWADRLVRTEMVNAYNVQAAEGLREAADVVPGLMQKWDATTDRVCPICKALDGAIARVGRPFRGGYMQPPAHPNCRCALIAWHRDWRD